MDYPATIDFEADGKTHNAVVASPTVPIPNQMIREVDGVKYAIAISVQPGYGGFVARPVKEA